MRARWDKKVFVVAWMLICAVFGVAQGTEGTYRLQPEDILRIQVYNEVQINVLVTVGRDGNISAPFVGILRAQGRTTSELEEDLVKEYQKKLRIRDPKVSVTIEKFRELYATIGGMVQRPGRVPIRPGDTIATLISQGNPDLDRADLRRATLRRSNSVEQIPVDLYSLLYRGDTSQNYQLEDGDELIVPENPRNRIYVIGTVQAPGAFPYKEPMRVMDALAMARGEIQRETFLSRVKVLREQPGFPGQYVEIKANLVRFLNNGDYAQNVALEPGDIVYVPRTKTPNLNEIGAAVNSAFFIDRFLREGLFGLRIPFIGR
ncbi:MAG: polysaccharide biosynthesis/export family protein [Fimbriimonadaceae bacterium]|nr:polysaccharide biosynthesis/export family protein [Fimbriimonadaceae bacterium]